MSSYLFQCDFVFMLGIQDGQQFGDEYLAELDYIEVVERVKDGFESNVDEDEGIMDDLSTDNSVPADDSDR